MVVNLQGLPYPSDLTDNQWELLAPVFNAPGKRGRKHSPDLRTVVDAMLYIARTGCPWRYLPESFGQGTRVWSQFRRWSRNGTWARALAVLHAAVRRSEGRTEQDPSMVVIDTHPRWRVEVAHGLLGRSQRLAKSFENTTSSATGRLQIACVATTLRSLAHRPTRQPARHAA